MDANIVEKKIVIVIDSELPIGLIANTATVIGITLGQRYGSIIGKDITDASNQCHLGITGVPIPILKGTKDSIDELLEKIRNQYAEELTVIDFSKTAQLCTDYEDYIKRVEQTEAAEFEYLGIGIYGSKKVLNKLTGSMALLR